MKTKQIRNNGLALLALVFTLPLGAWQAHAAEASAKNAELRPGIFAKVGAVEITQREYDAAYANMARSRFYHGKPAESELAAFQREVGDKLITDTLLVIEAKRRKLKPDSAFIKEKLKQQEEANAGNPNWEAIREQAIPALTKRLEESSLRERLEAAVRKVPAPTKKQLRKYYSTNPKLFTEPEQVRVSVILLKVDPSSRTETWKAAESFGQDLIKQVNEGADFAELAVKFSGDAGSAAQGGDMGYLHAGMLGGVAEERIKKLKPGELSDVVRLMEGVAIFKLTDRKEATLSSFDRVEDRARALWAEAESERRWKEFLVQLRKNIPVSVDKSRYTPQ